MMASLLYLSISLLIFSTSRGHALDLDDIEYGLRSGHMMKMLREMVNQTDADTLNLPANATSIRENITDTFSCENRTYGYYADVDNECQVFHVCLPSQSTSQRNVTYRWSFICPNETIFNQDVLTCTRPRDSIDCEDSPMYYDRNYDMYKTNDTDTQANSDAQNTRTSADSTSNTMKRMQVNKNKKTGSGNRKQNNGMHMKELIKDTRKPAEEQLTFKQKKPMAELLNDNRKPISEAMKDKTKKQIDEMKEKPKQHNEVMENKQRPDVMMEIKKPMNIKEIKIEDMVYVDKEKVEMPVTEDFIEFEFKDPVYGMTEEDEEMGNVRIFGKRSLKEEKRNKKRGFFRFKADV